MSRIGTPLDTIRDMLAGTLIALPQEMHQALDALKDERVQQLLHAIEVEKEDASAIAMYCDWLRENFERQASDLDEPITEEWLAECCRFKIGNDYRFDGNTDCAIAISGSSASGIRIQGQWNVYINNTFAGTRFQTRRHVVNLCEALLMKPWHEIVAHNRGQREEAVQRTAQPVTERDDNDPTDEQLDAFREWFNAEYTGQRLGNINQNQLTMLNWFVHGSHRARTSILATDVFVRALWQTYINQTRSRHEPSLTPADLGHRHVMSVARCESQRATKGNEFGHRT